MKTKKPSSLIKKQSQLNLKQSSRLALWTSLVLGLSACQSTTVLTHDNTLTHNQNPEHIKSTLLTALQKHHGKAYAYDANLSLFNENRQRALSQASELQKSMSDSAYRHCEQAHDKAYAALLEYAESNGKDINDDEYASQRAKLERFSQNCDLDYQIWEASIEDRSLDDYDFDTQDSVVTPDELKTDELKTDKLENSSDTAFKLPEYIEHPVIIDNQYVQEHFDIYKTQPYLADYDNEHTQLDAKRAKLIDSYLLKPLSISATGVYNPKAGYFTMSPVIKYQARNHTTAINQPIYFDAKSGSLYVWADNFAKPVSDILDNKLGASWHNKWLKLALNDGSLPKGFGRSLIKAYFAALQHAYAATDSDNYKVLSTSSLHEMAPAISDKYVTGIKDAKLIVQNRFSQQDYDDYMAVFYRHFINDIESQYPQLSEPINANNADNHADDSDDNSGDEHTPDSSDSLDGYSRFNSKAIMLSLLDFMKQEMAKNDTDDISDMGASDGTDSMDNGNDESIQVQDATKKQASVIKYAKISQEAVEIQPYQEVYGLDKHQNILWLWQRIQLPNVNKNGVETGEGLVMNSFISFTDIKSADVLFPNLPKNMQVPNDSNSIDIRDYSQSLIEMYKNGEGTELGKMIFR